MSDTNEPITPPGTPTADHTTADAVPDAAEPSASRQCARCRHHFPVEVGTHSFELIGWWACSECTTALLPARSRATTA